MLSHAFLAFTVMITFRQDILCQGDYYCSNGGTQEADLFTGRTSCRCTREWTGYKCEKINCDAGNICYNGGTCLPDSAIDFCSCVKGYAGSRCEKKATQCDDNPCYYGSTCLYDGSRVGFRCRCSKFYYGGFCNITVCAESNPLKCLNGGTCLWSDPVHDDVGFLQPRKCLCADNYYGGYCEHVDSCLSSPCLNGGTCKFDGRRFRYECQCPFDYNGTHCEVKATACDGNPCLNGGTCEYDGSSKGYRCLCAYGYDGEFCKIMVGCSEKLECLNDGDCVPRIVLRNSEKIISRVCVCEEDYYGRFCEHVDPCLSSPCQTGRSCRLYKAEFRYVCL